MKKRVLTILLVMISFMLGFCADLSVNILSVETTAIAKLFSPDRTFSLFEFQAILLFLSHLGVISLLFLQRRSFRYFKTVLAYSPPIFVVSYVWIALIAFMFYPIMWVSVFLFIFIWFVLLFREVG